MFPLLRIWGYGYFGFAKSLPLAHVTQFLNHDYLNSLAACFETLERRRRSVARRRHAVMYHRLGLLELPMLKSKKYDEFIDI